MFNGGLGAWRCLRGRGQVSGAKGRCATPIDNEQLTMDN